MKLERVTNGGGTEGGEEEGVERVSGQGNVKVRGRAREEQYRRRVRRAVFYSCQRHFSSSQPLGNKNL